LVGALHRLDPLASAPLAPSRGARLDRTDSARRRRRWASTPVSR
jgi:hypothetical protein